MRRPIHILIVTPGFPENEDDSICIPALQDYLLAIRATHPQIKFTVISMQYPESGAYNWNDIDVISIGGNNQKGIKKYRTWIKTKKQVMDAIRREQIDLIHALWTTEAAYLSHKISQKLRLPYLVTAMGQDVINVPSYLSKVKFSTLVYVSAYQKECSTLTASDVQTIEWGVKSIKSKAEKHIDVIGVGSLIQVKKWDRFIKIAAKLKANDSNLNIQLVGDGPLRNALISLNESLGSPVNMVGELNRESTTTAIASSRIVLHTANYESFCMVMAEGLAAGCDVIATNVGLANSQKNIHTFDTNEEAAQLIMERLKSHINEINDYPKSETCADNYAQLYYELLDSI